jgi:hypothetical protein
MTRIFENRNFAGRLNIYVVVLIIVMANGVWELWSALRAPVPSTTDLLFAAAFIGGGLYGLYQTFIDGRDLVGAFDVDFAAGTAAVTLWRPFRRIRLDGALDRMTGWRFWVKAGQGGQRSYLLHADFPGYPRKLQFELRRGAPVPDGLRQIAPEAIADFEDATGVTKAATESAAT